MPCRGSTFWRCRRADDSLPTLSATSDAPDVESWMKVRRTYIRRMRKQTRKVLLLMALIEALKIEPAQLVYSGREGYPAPGKEDYGLVYTVSYIISYIYVCVFMLFYVPLFSWWAPESIPNNPESPSLTMKIFGWVEKFNMISLPIYALVEGIIYLICLAKLFIYVDDQPIGSRKLPKNNRKNWGSRFLLSGGILISLSLGYGAFYIWEMYSLIHVKTLEYAIIIVPIQINMGVMIGSRMQMKAERRIAMKKAALEQIEEEQHVLAVDEKTRLMEV